MNVICQILTYQRPPSTLTCTARLTNKKMEQNKTKKSKQNTCLDPVSSSNYHFLSLHYFTENLERFIYTPCLRTPLSLFFVEYTKLMPIILIFLVLSKPPLAILLN